MSGETYRLLGGSRHRHGRVEHAHPHRGPHHHEDGRRAHDHGHSHGLVDPSIKRSRDGVRAVALALAVLGATALAQAAVFVATGSVALLADLVHNAGDAATAIPLAAAFMLRSARAERWAGRAVVAAILVSAVVAGSAAIERMLHPSDVHGSARSSPRGRSASPATRPPRRSAPAPDAGSRARRWSRTAHTPAQTRSSRSPWW